MQIPQTYVDICCGWYNGQGSLMYAVASTGGLSRGGWRPRDENGNPASDREWDRQLWAELGAEIRAVQRMNGHSVRQARQLRGFERLTNRMEKRFS